MHVVRKGGHFSSNKQQFYQKRGLIAVICGALLPAILISFSAIVGGIVGLCLLTFGLQNLRRAWNWQKGMIGEEHVVEKLSILDNSFTLINDVVLPNVRGNIDHILIGPNRVFLIETKSYRWHPLNPFPFKQTLRNAILLRQFVKEQVHVDLFVEAILISTDPRSKVNGRTSTVVNGHLKVYQFWSWKSVPVGSMPRC